MHYAKHYKFFIMRKKYLTSDEMEILKTLELKKEKEVKEYEIEMPE